MLRAKRYTPEDYKSVSALWRQYPDWAPLPESSLPERGMVVMEDGVYLAAGFLYSTDSDICWLEWVVGNAQVESDKRREAISHVVDSIIDWSKELGYKNVFSSVVHPNLIKLYKEKGMMTDNLPMINFIGVLENMGGVNGSI